MPLSTTPSIDTQQPPQSGDAVSRKARFWDRIARKYAADPIADMSGTGAGVDQSLLSSLQLGSLDESLPGRRAGERD